MLEIYASAQIHAIVGIVLVTDHLGVDAGNIEISRCVEATSSDDYLGVFGLICQAADDRFLIEEI